MVITRSTFSHFSTLLLLCISIFITCSIGYAQALLPWESQNSVRSTLLDQDGQSILLEKVTVSRVEARNDPAYFVVQDRFMPDKKLIILSRPPSVLVRGMIIDVAGTLATLDTGERCLTNATTFGYFNIDGSLAGWSYYFLLHTNKQALSVPATPIPPSDPSITADGRGILGAVTSEPIEKPSVFDTVGSLITTTPPVLSTVEIPCKPVKEVGAGYITVGDDNSDTAVKVYTNAFVRPTDRIIKLTGTVHTENGRIVIYADNGPDPYFDCQGYIGHVSTAGIGTVAYASTLNDPTVSQSRTGGICTMSVSTPEATDGDWVYLTGQVITYARNYWSYTIPTPGWIVVYNIQGIDRTPGMRVWDPSSLYGSSSMPVGSVVDIMAKVDAKDGQRILGIWSSVAGNVTNLDSLDHSMEPKVLALGPSLNVVPVGMNNRTLGGAALGNNLSVTGGSGLYNIGSYVTVYGEVLESGTYQFGQGFFDSVPYMRIDDGSAVPSDGSIGEGVIVYGCNSHESGQAAAGDYVAITGVSSVWKPSGSTDTYRCIWTTNIAKKLLNPSTPTETREVTASGTISGTVKLYDMPEETATVHICSTCGRSETLEINRESDNSGSETFSWSGIPKTAQIGWSQEDIKYIISAKCDGYKTRTYTEVSPDTPRNLYLPRLRKIYVTTSATTIDSHMGGSYPTSTTITATVRDADHNPIQGVTVRFRTSNGSFHNDTIVHSYEGLTGSTGQVTAILYGVSTEAGYNVVVKATDDSAPLAGDPLLGDTYNYDWEQVHDNYAQPVTITINPSSVMSVDTFVLTADPYSVPPSQSSSTITAKLTTLDGANVSGRVVTFTTTVGTLSAISGYTNEDGEVTTTLSGVPRGDFAVVEASTINDYGETRKRRVQVDFLKSTADDWPMFMHDSRHQGYSRFYDTQTTENLTFAWSAPVPTSNNVRYPPWGQHPLGGHSSFVFPHPYIDSSPVHANGCPVITGAWASGDYSSSTGYVKAFNPTTGADAWRYPAGTGTIGGVASTPAVFTSGSEKRVVFGSMDGKVYCLNASTGAFRWSYQTTNRAGAGNGAVLASPTVDTSTGTVYIGNESSKFYALDGNTSNTNGSLLWNVDLPVEGDWNDRTGLSSAALGTVNEQLRLYIGSDNGHVYCLSTEQSPTERIIWDYAGEDGTGIGCVESSPTVYAGNVYVGTSWFNGTDILALDAESGTLVWHKELFEEFRATAAVSEGHVYVGEDTGTRFFRLDAVTGNVNPNQYPQNPFHAEYNRPNPAGEKNYFVGSAAYTSAGFGIVGNDNFALYTFSSADNSLINNRGTGGIVCSSPAISYAAQSNYRWIYVVSRANGGTLFAYRQSLN